MRIVLAHSHANTLGGGERAILELARALARRHEVRLLLGGFDPRRTYPELASLPAQRLGRLAWPLARPAGDALITNTFGANLLALRNGPRVVYWVHTTRSLYLRPGARRLDLQLRRMLDWAAVRRSARLVANSRYTAGRLRALYGREPDAVVYPGVDLDLFRPLGADQPPAGEYAITVGRLSPEKGLDRLLDLWRELPDLPLQVIGDGPPEVIRELRQRAPTGVTIRGRLLPADLADAYRRAAVAVFAPYGEEFGLAPLEAMASGIPVVAWRDGGLQETVVDGQTGYLVDDAITLRQRVRVLLRDRRRWQGFAAAARARAEAFTWDQAAAAFERLCASLVST